MPRPLGHGRDLYVPALVPSLSVVSFGWVGLGFFFGGGSLLGQKVMVTWRVLNRQWQGVGWGGVRCRAAWTAIVGWADHTQSTCSGSGGRIERAERVSGGVKAQHA